MYRFLTLHMYHGCFLNFTYYVQQYLQISIKSIKLKQCELPFPITLHVSMAVVAVSTHVSLSVWISELKKCIYICKMDVDAT